MKCCIIGAGAIGGHLAVKLHGAGHEVSVIARGTQLAAIESAGLVLEQGELRLHAPVRASADERALGEQDLVFIATKATALREIAAYLPALVGAQTRVAFLQNGMTWWYPIGLPTDRPSPPTLPIFGLGEVFLRMMRPDQVLAGIIYSANELACPGVVRNNSPRHNAIELAAIDDDDRPAVREARAVLEQAGIASPPLDNIRTALWLKLVGNACTSSLCVATGNLAAVVTDSAVQGVFLRMLGECMQVAAAHGYPVADKMDLSRWTQHRARHKPSMLQDYEAGRPMEIAEMVLAPAVFARAVALDTPTLDAVTAIAARLAADRGLFKPT
jgi:2-dehydropantoate 2-reductase